MTKPPQSVLDELDAIRENGCWRSLRALPASGGKLTLEGRTLLNFSSNDYLNLANDGRVKQAARETIALHGCGATASRLMSGHLGPHARVEERLAWLTGQDSALVFSSGFQVNTGVLTSLAGQDDAIFSDELNHASIVDGTRLSRAETHIYLHKDTKNLKKLLEENKSKRRRIIVTDTVFSMDGDLAPVEALAELAEAYDALLVVDEAHAIGIFGEGGGLCKAHGIRPDVTVGTLSKSLGSGGGFAACGLEIRDLLINRARSFIFSTGLAPGCAGAAAAAVNILEDEPGLGTMLLERASYFRDRLRTEGLAEVASESPVIPILVGDNDAVMRLSERLWEAGLLMTGIRPPTVPVGTARLRLSVTLAHTEADLDHAARIIAGAVNEERERA